RREHPCEERAIGPRLEERRAAIEGLPEGGMRAIELRAHPRPLRALAREDEGERPGLAARDRTASGGLAENGAQLLERGDRGCEANGKLAATEVARVADVGEIDFGQRAAPLAKALDVGVERGGALGGEREEMQGPRLRRRRRLRPLLEDHEGIGAADAERVDPGAPRMAA